MPGSRDPGFKGARRAAFDTRRSPFWVYVHAAHPGEVDHETVFRDRGARHIVAAHADPSRPFPMSPLFTAGLNKMHGALYGSAANRLASEAAWSESHQGCQPARRRKSHRPHQVEVEPGLAQEPEPKPVVDGPGDQGRDE